MAILLNRLSIIETKFLILKEITEVDLQDIINLRRSRSNNHLSPVSSNLNDQIAYYEKYKRRRAENSEIYYKIIDKCNPSPIAGLVRLTEINDPIKFSWESLIVADGVAPYTALDAMMTIYRIGFETLHKKTCGPWTVPIDAKNVYSLHKKVGMASEVGKDEKFYYMAVEKKDFLARYSFFKKMGFGLYNLLKGPYGSISKKSD
jgi:hypothetical protein